MLILDEEIPLKDNIQSSFQRYWGLWIVLILTTFFDYVSTLSFMWEDGIHTEKNFIVKWLAYKIGIIPGVFLAKIMQIISAIGFAALSATLARATLLLILLLNTMAIIHNLL